MTTHVQQNHGRDGTPCRPPTDDVDSINAELQLAAKRGQHGVPSLPTRKTLPHEPPLSLPDGAIWFITICCRQRGRNQFAHESSAAKLFSSALLFHQKGRWFIHLLLLMPDHLHALLSFPQHEQMTRVVRAWKRFQATHHGVCWQRDFFDHRLRSDESFEEKANYIRMNPVRADLVAAPADWPYVLGFDGRDGTPLPSASEVGRALTANLVPDVDRAPDGTECRPYQVRAEL